jgi:DNA-binding transcriptional regulator GbsR (MarR family)
LKNQEAKQEFINLWGALGSQWGINRSMAQIHALLLLTPGTLTTEDIMDQLQLSRGNANMNIRELINWNLVYKNFVPGERKEFFKAEHDIWTVATRIMNERKKRELVPAKKMAQDIRKIKLAENNAESKHIQKTISDMDDFLGRIDQLSELMLKAEKNIIFKKMMNLLK